MPQRIATSEMADAQQQLGFDPLRLAHLRQPNCRLGRSQLFNPLLQLVPRRT